MANANAAVREFKYFEYTGSNPVAAVPLDLLAEVVSQYKEIDGVLQAADGDKEKAVTAWMETSDHAEAVKLRKAIELATNKLKDLAEKNAKTVNLSKEEKDKLENQRTEKKAEIRTGIKSIVDLLEFVKQDVDGVKAALEEIGDPSRSGRGRKIGEKGSETPRAYVILTVNGGDFKDRVFDTFSKFALATGADVPILQEEFAKAAGVDPKNVSQVKTPVEFKFQVNGNGPVYTISTTPKEVKRRGRKPASETKSEAEKTEAVSAS